MILLANEDKAMQEKPEIIVSIIINNYNYGRFISEAINSACNQTYKHIEVIVVDDGSTDNSRDVIASYGEQIIPLLKENGGQGSACNAGFEISKGEIIIFLDSDDVLLPDTVQQVVSAFQSQPDVAKVQYRLQIIDAVGKLTEKIVPLPHWHMPSGDLREQMLREPNYIWPPTSGNAFAAAALRQIIPIPESLFKVAVDIYLNDLAVLFGSLISLDQVGALYRMHGTNDSQSFKTVHLALLRNDMMRMNVIHSKRKEILKKIYPSRIIDTESKDTKLFVGRTISLKLDPSNHPLKDNLLFLCSRGFMCSVFLGQERWHVRLLLGFWFIAMYFAPKPMAQFLADNLLYDEKRGKWINKLRTMVQMIG